MNINVNIATLATGLTSTQATKVAASASRTSGAAIHSNKDGEVFVCLHGLERGEAKKYQTAVKVEMDKIERRRKTSEITERLARGARGAAAVA